MGEAVVYRSHFLDTMPRKDFYYQIVRGPANSRDFSHLIMAGPEFVHQEQCRNVRQDLLEVGVPLEDIDTDEKLYDVVRGIASRAVAVR